VVRPPACRRPHHQGRAPDELFAEGDWEFSGEALAGLVLASDRELLGDLGWEDPGRPLS
jgi:hypothetical protein